MEGESPHYASSARLLCQFLPAGARVLDFGCGAGAEVIALCSCRRRVRWGRCGVRPKRRGAEHSKQRNSLLAAKMVATTRFRLATHRRRQPSLACERGAAAEVLRAVAPDLTRLRWDVSETGWPCAGAGGETVDRGRGNLALNGL
jgi:hypothetical protein